MRENGFWSRVGHWLKPSEKSDGDSSPSAVVAETTSLGSSMVEGELLTPSECATATKPEDAIVQPSASRLSRREITLERLQEGYNKVIGLVESIQDHLEVQDRRSESMSSAMAEMAERIGEVGRSSAGQLETLSAMKQQLESDSARGKRLEEQLAQLPRIADAQRETMASIGRQLDLSNRTAGEVAETLGGFQSSVGALAEATDASTVALRELHRDAGIREDRMARLLESQTKRISWIASIAALVALAAIVTALLV